MRCAGRCRSTIRSPGHTRSKLGRCTNQRFLWCLQNSFASAAEARRRWRGSCRTTCRRSPWLSPTRHEGMAQSSLGLHPSLGIPNKTFRNEINKLLIVAAEDLLQCLGSRSASASLGINDCPRDTIRIWMGLAKEQGSFYVNK